MNADTIPTAIDACRIVLDFWRRDVRDEWTMYVKSTRQGNNRRRVVARRMVRLRAAIRDLEAQQPQQYPAWMSEPENALLAYAVEGR